MKPAVPTGLIFPYKARFTAINWINREVMLLQMEKPYGFNNSAGQALAVSIDKPGYELEVAPFTITNFEDEPFLKLIVKIRGHKGSLTKGLSELRSGDVLQLSEPWDTYTYKGPGTFIAAGTGVIPFVAMLKQFEKHRPEGASLKRHHFIYSSRNREGMLFKNWLQDHLGSNFIPVLSSPVKPGLKPGRIDQHFLARHLRRKEHPIYVCGPQAFEKDIKRALLNLGVAESLIQTGYKV